MKKDIKVVYSEPADYFSCEIREKYKLGEFAESRELKAIKSVVIGHAVGDALGVPVEFSTREELEENPVTSMRGFGTYSVPAGAWSDDTSTSLCALDALANGEVDLDEIMFNLEKWLLSSEYTPTGEMFDAGRTCVRAIMRYFREKLEPERCGGCDELSNGNGSLMRIHPFVLYARAKKLDCESKMELIKNGSSLTHAHKRSVLACYIYAYCLEHILDVPSRESLVEEIGAAGRELSNLPEFDHYRRIFSPDFASLDEKEIRSSGYVVDTLEAALWCLLNTDNYRDCVLKAVNLGGDTDTVAAVAGGLAGAMYGYESIPEEWLDTLIKREYIEGMCERAYKNWFDNAN